MTPFSPPPSWIRIETVDAHTGGEPLRVVLSGLPDVPGDTILEKRRHARAHHDHLRRALMLEPRGHADMYGCWPTEPVTPDGDLGVLFLHNEGFSTMCGHGIIGVVKVGLECGLIDVSGESPTIRIDTPAGRVTATACRRDGRVESVTFRNVPSFVLEADLEVDVPDLGRVRCDLAFGGAFYAYVEASDVGLEIKPENQARCIEVGMAIKRAVTASYRIRHPAGDPDLEFLYGTILVDRGSDDVHSRNVCVFAEGEVDRCPTGTGVCGRAAIHHARGELLRDQIITIESIIGSRFEVVVRDEVEVGGCRAVVPEVTGSAHITGRHSFVIDPDDPLRNGFLLR